MRWAYQVEVGAAEHGAFECLDAVDLAFDGAGAVGQAESGGDRGVVAAQACHEGVQAGRSSDSTACIQRVPRCDDVPHPKQIADTVTVRVRTWIPCSPSLTFSTRTATRQGNTRSANVVSITRRSWRKVARSYGSAE
jgi:hypothetical protein